MNLEQQHTERERRKEGRSTTPIIEQEKGTVPRTWQYTHVVSKPEVIALEKRAQTRTHRQRKRIHR
jgi:hypothetical protein